MSLVWILAQGYVKWYCGEKVGSCKNAFGVKIEGVFNEKFKQWGIKMGLAFKVGQRDFFIVIYA